MAIEESDWRLQGQEAYLQGVVLVHRPYRQNPTDPEWNHDHCEFCWSKFALYDDPGVLHVGYATEDDYRWICEPCFADFCEMFGWTVIETPSEQARQPDAPEV